MPLFTKENAAILGRKGAEARWNAPDPQPDPPQSPPIAEEPSFDTRLKARVRLQIDSVCDQLEKEAGKSTCDGAKLDRLASALERLAELERVLDGRPGPGNRRPPREDLPAARPQAAPRPPAIPTPASATQPAQVPEPAPPRGLLSEPPEF